MSHWDNLTFSRTQKGDETKVTVPRWLWATVVGILSLLAGTVVAWAGWVSYELITQREVNVRMEVLLERIEKQVCKDKEWRKTKHE